MKPTLSVFSVLSLLVAGCVDEPGLDDDLEPVDAEPYVGWTSLSGLYQTQTTGETQCNFRSCIKSLGPATDRTCFLAGLKGSLSEASASYPAGAVVNVVNYGVSEHAC